jgi:TusA-related sulfurtransferase
MDTSTDKTGVGAPELFLDITGEICPMTFVRSKLLIERMVAGQTAVIRLRGAEPIANVPRAVAAHGLVVLDLVKEDPAADAQSVHRLIVRKP